jgi:hypothetical protein
MNRILGAALCVALALSLAACTTTDASNVTAKTFDSICASEPAIYAAYVTVATAKGVNAKKLATAAAAHQSIAATCANPPADLASAVSSIATAYATIVTARADAAKKGA